MDYLDKAPENISDDKNEKDNKNDSGINKTKLIATIALLTGGSIATVVGIKGLYDTMFSRYNRPDYNLYPGCYCYDRVSHLLPRKEVTFPSKNVNLRGYCYINPNPKGCVVVSHGLHAGADEYLPIILFFYKNGYSVFGFNYQGTYESEGNSTVGMCQSLVDLDYALNYVKNCSDFIGLDVMLVGHSWGGFAVTSVLNLHKEVKACACISALNNGYTMILEKGEQYGGSIASGGIPKGFLDVYQKILFKDYAKYNGAQGINSVNIPVLVAHGKDDMVISYDGQSVMAQRASILNPNVIYYTGTGLQGGHDSIWHSEQAVLYQKQVKDTLKNLERQKGSDFTYEEKSMYYNQVNHQLYSEINNELFDKILKMFDDACNK